MKLFKYSLSIVVAFILSMMSTQSVHASSGESIANYRVNMAVSGDGSATITELIEYDFGSNDKHGLYRYIPYSAKLPSGKFYNYDFSLTSLERDGSSEKYSLISASRSTSGQNWAIKIGDSKKTISGQHTYTIVYRVDRVVQRDEAGDYINWDMIGTEWEVPIRQSKVTIELPAGITLLPGARCYLGEQGSTQTCDVSTLPQSVASTIGDLAPYEGVTLNLLTAPNSFSNYLEEADAPKVPPANPADLRDALIGVGIGGLVIVSIVMVVIIGVRNSIITHKRRGQQTVIAEYEPPDGLNPAQLGLLSDNVAAMREITATLIDLAVRGQIRSNRTQTGTVFKKFTYTFELLKGLDSQQLQIYERDLLTTLFGDQQSVALADVKQAEMAKTIQGISKQVTQELQAKGYFAQKQRWFAHPDNVTTEGYKEWAKVEGFKLFLSVTEKDRLAFSDAPDKNPKQFNALLPYAIALGVEQQWAKQFASMDISSEAGWYHDPYNSHFTAAVLAQDLSGNFSTAVTSNFSPPSSSGGSGGGFSGGGGGGGGGGSW